LDNHNCYRNYTVGATDSQTYKDSSTKITHNKNNVHDSWKLIASTPRLKSQLTSQITIKDDPNKAAMEALKEKLKEFIHNHQNVVKSMQNEINMLRKENESLKQNTK